MLLVLVLLFVSRYTLFFFFFLLLLQAYNLFFPLFCSSNSPFVFFFFFFTLFAYLLSFLSFFVVLRVWSPNLICRSVLFFFCPVPAIPFTRTRDVLAKFVENAEVALRTMLPAMTPVAFWGSFFFFHYAATLCCQSHGRCWQVFFFLPAKFFTIFFFLRVSVFFFLFFFFATLALAVVPFFPYRAPPPSTPAMLTRVMQSNWCMDWSISVSDNSKKKRKQIEP